MTPVPMRRLSLLAVVCAVACTRGRLVRPDDETLVVFAERDVEGLDPHTSGQVWQTQMVLANLYEGLVTRDDQLALSPGLATAWSSPDDLTWVFEVRPGVRFHDGSILDAEDVVQSLLRARDHPRSALRVDLAGVASVEAVSPQRIRVRTRRRDASLASRLSEVPIVSRRCVEAGSDEALATTSCGTGPYQVSARRPGDYVELSRFEGYRGQRPPIARARFVARSFGGAGVDRFVPPGTRLLFWTHTGTPADARARRDFVPHFSPGLAVLYLSFDLHGPESPGVRLPRGKRGNPFLDPRVREAVATALGFETLRAQAPEEVLEAQQLVPPSVLGYDPSLPPRRTDPAAARELLRRTRFGEGFDVDLDLRRIHARLGPALSRSLAEIGIHVNTQVQAEEEFFDRLASRRSSLALLRFSCWTGDAQAFYDKCVRSRRPAEGYGVFNFSYDNSPVTGLDELIEAAREESFTRERLRLLRHVMRRVLEAHLLVPLLRERLRFFASPGVEWRPRADTLVLVQEIRIGASQ